MSSLQNLYMLGYLTWNNQNINKLHIIWHYLWQVCMKAELFLVFNNAFGQSFEILNHIMVAAKFPKKIDGSNFKTLSIYNLQFIGVISTYSLIILLVIFHQDHNGQEKSRTSKTSAIKLIYWRRRITRVSILVTVKMFTPS